MNDELKGKCFRDLLAFGPFEAQLALEADIRTSLLNKMLSLELNDTKVALEYARIRGALEILKTLQSKRDLLAEAARASSQ